MMDEHKVLTDQSEGIIKVESSIGSVNNTRSYELSTIETFIEIYCVLYKYL